MNRFRIHFCTVGLLFGALFFAVSLTPSLLPRSDAVQGVLSGLAMAAGYGVGVLATWVWAGLELPQPAPRTQRLVHRVAWVLCAMLTVSFLWQASNWQNNVRALMEMEPVPGLRGFLVGVIALVVFLAAVLVAKGFWRLFALLSAQLNRVMPRRISRAAGLLLAFGLFWAIVEGVLVNAALRSADLSHQQIDALIEPESQAPEEASATGSAQSLIDWEDLGRQGRRFVSTGPGADDIAVLSNAAALDPLRVYVGLNAAESPEERARLARRELERVGGFERSMLVMIAPTGTGWVDPAGIAPLEYLQQGDIASVAAQYSYLPSPVSLMAEGAYGEESTRELFREIYGHWRDMDPDQRPRLYIFGLSLGALHSDRAFDLYDIIDDPFDGVLWSGPPFRTGTWQTATYRRQPDSPAWLPRFRDDSVIRFGNQDGGFEQGQAPWGDFRIAFLQYASDPITFFTPDSFLREPAWMSGPRAPDVSEDLRWFPIVTGLQLAADMGMGSSPVGFGHDYAAEHYLDAWLALTEPDSWDEPGIRRLRQHLARD